MNKVENMFLLVLQSRMEILVTVQGLGHGVPVCGFHTQLFANAISTIIPYAGLDKARFMTLQGFGKHTYSNI